MIDTEIKDNKILIDPLDILREMKGDDKVRLIEALSCEDEVIKHVSDQIVHGCTENGWHGGKVRSETPSTALDKAIREVSIHASDIAAKEIEKLEWIVKSERELGKEGWDKYHELSKRGSIY